MHFQGLIASMEDVDNALPVDETEAAETAVAVADNSTEVQEESDQAAVTVAQVEDAVQAGEELEDIGAVAVDAVEGGEGLTEEGAELASIAIESIRSRLGIRTATRLVPSCESFGNTNTRMMSTKMVIEGITDTIKSIWNAIKAAAKRVWDILASFFAKLFNSATMLSKHIQGLRERARALPAGVKPKEKTLSSSSIGKAFTIMGTVDMSAIKLISENTQKLAVAAKFIGGEQSAVASAAVSLASSEINEASVKKFLEVQGKCSEGITKETATWWHASAELGNIETVAPKNKSAAASNAYGPFVGNVNLVVTTHKTKILDTDAQRVSLSFVPAKKKSAEKIVALSLSEVNEVLAEAAKLANGLADFKKVQGEYEAITKQANKVADTVMNSAAKLLDKTGSSTTTRQGLQELKNEVSGTISNLNAFGNRAPALVFSLAKAMADYASISIRNLQEGK